MTKEQAIEKAKEQYSEIWDCDINHPKYEDTVEEIVTGVIRLIMQPTSDDCVSIQATLDAIIKELCIKDESYLLQSEKAIYNVVKNMPPVTPTHGTCKDCFYYNIDEDGRGYHCEKYGHTRFPVYADFYCKDFEKRGGENESIN